ncbi:hypothetical protein LZG74_16990 [Dyadobacter sp. CY327]|uniref:hypothetical protein n=1 Tax=Dyadobacter sp. CY327 TaxID=2907301 RepID=UPI001F1BBB3D|nr:hypothetical protein [Dyadobacter sp. CY327]MCE7072015.1 hypothetical protein [Dyadobacter sp. CY327]
MENSVLSTDLATIDLFSSYLNTMVGTDREKALNPSETEKQYLNTIEPAVKGMMEDMKATNRDNFLIFESGYDGLTADESRLNYFLTIHREQFKLLLPLYRSHYIQEVKRITFDKPISELSGREFNAYLQVIGLIK